MALWRTGEWRLWRWRARARAVPGDKPLKTCDNDEKETLCGLLLAYEVGVILRRA